MPEKVDRCVKSLLKKWRDNPDKAPKLRGGKDLEGMAWAACQDSIKQSCLESSRISDIQLGGIGPVLAGVGLTNRPYIKGMPKAQVVVDGEAKFIRVPFMRFGTFSHPKGPEGKLIFDDDFISRICRNFEKNEYGQSVFLDRAHKPDGDAGALGELHRIELEGGFAVGYFEPTEAGLEAVSKKRHNYGSMDLYLDYEGNEVSLSCSDDGFCEIDLVERASDFKLEEENMSGENKDATTTNVTLSQDEHKALLERAEAAEGNANIALAEVRAQRDQLYRRDVELFIGTAKLPVEGKAYSKPVLDTVRLILLGETIESENIKIELSEDGDGAVYFKSAVKYLLSVIPRDVQIGGDTGTAAESNPMKGEQEAHDKQRLADIKLAAESQGVPLDKAAEMYGVKLEELKGV